MPAWLLAILTGTSGGLVGYLFRGWIDDRFARAKESRALRQADVKALRDDLHVFLGQPRAHFAWLQNTPDVRIAGGIPSPEAKAEIIATWIYDNAMKHPKNRRSNMYLIANVAYQLARGDRHFLDINPKGYDTLEEAWTALDQYAQVLTAALHHPDQPDNVA